MAQWIKCTRVIFGTPAYINLDQVVGVLASDEGTLILGAGGAKFNVQQEADEIMSEITVRPVPLGSSS